jgi:ParE-like toxin of type II ParDE toxin-antitoxin system
MTSWHRPTNATAYEVRYTPRAFADREAIFEYFNRRNPRAAREIKAFIEKRISALGELEIRHRAIPKLGVHGWSTVGQLHPLDNYTALPYMCPCKR